jgi:hypothetical protein
MKCPNIGMNIFLILLALQVLVTVFSLIRECGEDQAFEGERIGYRS